MLGIGAADANSSKQVGIVRAGVHAVVVEHFADLDSAIEQRFAGALDVGDDQVQALGRAGRCRGDVPAEDDRARGARRRELDYAEVFAVIEVGVEPPPELGVELLRAVNIRDGDDDDLELHVGWRDAGVDATDCIGAHSCLLSWVISCASVAIEPSGRSLRSSRSLTRRQGVPPALSGYRNDLNEARSSSENTCRWSQAAKWPPLGSRL